MKRYTRKFKQIHKRGGGTKKYNKTKKCNDFCKNDFLPNRRRIYQKIARDNKVVYIERTPKEYKFALNTCKKVYCNKGCKNKLIDTGFYKDIKNNFKTSYTNEQINKLQEKGALSGCMKDDNYVDNYL